MRGMRLGVEMKIRRLKRIRIESGERNQKDEGNKN